MNDTPQERTIVVPMIDTSAKRTQQVLAGLGFYPPLREGIKRAIDAEARAHRAYIAPVGTPLDAQGWEPLGYASQDGFHLDTEPEPQPIVVDIADNGMRRRIAGYGRMTEEIRTTKSVEQTFTFTLHPMKSHRTSMRLLFGAYRLPGDRPLIHNGRKTR